MGYTNQPLPARLIMACMYSTKEEKAQALFRFTERVGPVLSVFGPFSVEKFTSYYEPEMGTGIQKEFFTFSRTIDPGQLAELKLFTNKIEAELTDDSGKRRCNLDPGYLTPDKLVLASTKDFFHRVYLGSGIYAEITLYYQAKRFNPLQWTYPDYKDPAARQFLEAERDQLVNLLRQLRASKNDDGQLS